MEPVEIGHNSTCGRGYIYCYATPDRPLMPVDPASPSLDPRFDLRKIAPERIVGLKVKSPRSAQLELF